MPDSPISFQGAIICDQVRREDNGKELLIGVYSAAVVLSSLPATIPLAVWLMLDIVGTGPFSFKVRVVGPHDAMTLETTTPISGDVSGVSRGSGAFTINHQFSFVHTGEYRVEARIGDGEWELVRRFYVQIANPLSN